MMEFRNSNLQYLMCVAAFLLIPTTSRGSEWRTAALPARPFNIAENNGTLWVCGADELIATSSDGGKTWVARHIAKGGGLILSIGFASPEVAYAAGTGGRIWMTRDAGNSWDSIKAPANVVYEIAFSDEKHGIVHAPRTLYITNDAGDKWVPVEVNLSDEDLKGFSYVRSVVALDGKHMAVVMSEGNSAAHAYRLLVTKDGGSTWSVTEVPNTGLGSLSVHGGEYWFAGMEVIEKDKPGGGYGVPAVMHSKDGDEWVRVPRWAKNEFSDCNSQGCLYWDGAGLQIPPTDPLSFWTFAPEKMVTARWAVAKGQICAVAVELKCSAVATTQVMPTYSESSSPIPAAVSAPPLDAPISEGLQCLYCGFERIVVTPDFQGPVEVQIRLQIGPNGLVEQADIVRATNSKVGERIAASARSWVFLPFVKDGAVRPATTQVKLRVQAIKSR